MFSRSDGPTALRADLVHALSFSVQQAELEGPLGLEPAVAAMAAGIVCPPPRPRNRNTISVS